MRRSSWLLAGVLLLGSAAAALPATAAEPVRLLTGSTPDTAPFPSDAFTVADKAQLTGKRIAFPVPTCTEATSSTCDAVKLLNTLDGFDLQPRVFLPFSGDIDVTTVTPATVYVEGNGGRVGLQQLTFDPATHLLAGTTRDQLAEQTAYTLVVTRSVRAKDGSPLAAEVRTPFTTMSGTTELDRMRKALDDGSAYRDAGIASRAASFTQGATTTVFPPTDAELINRNDQTAADPKAPLTSSQVPNLAVTGAGCYAFGSIESPQWSRDDSTIVPTASGSTPPVQGKARIGFALIVPAGSPPAGGWPTAVYGPGFTRSYFDLFVTSDENAAAGIATIATDPLGHGFGPASTISVGLPGAATTFSSYGRGHDLDGDGKITESEGSQPTKKVTLSGGKVVAEAPSPDALQGLRGGLEQSALDNMALVRAVQAGISVPSCAASPGATLAKTDVKYYGLSFGGIYGTMLMGTDPTVKRALLNVAGGPIVEIARLSGFRPLLGDQLRVSRPTLANGGPGRDGFTESIPQPYQAPITAPAPGAMTLQRYLAYATWYGRPGGPETYAPLLRKDPRNGLKDVLYQIAFGDNTVPNITGGNIIRAGGLFDRVTYYRNDETPTMGTNPHGWLADPTLTGRQNGEVQLTTFLSTGMRVDPDGPAPVFETPIVNQDDLQCLHYPDPQTGEGAYPPAAAGECPPRPADKVVAAPGADATPSASATSTTAPPASAAPVATETPVATAASASPSAGAGVSDGATVAGGSLPRTGLTVLVPLLAALTVAGGVALRRRRT